MKSNCGSSVIELDFQVEQFQVTIKQNVEMSIVNRSIGENAELVNFYCVFGFYWVNSSSMENSKFKLKSWIECALLFGFESEFNQILTFESLLNTMCVTQFLLRLFRIVETNKKKKTQREVGHK